MTLYRQIFKCSIANHKTLQPTIEEILKLLIDRESGAKVSAIAEPTARAFKAFQENSKKPKERRISSKDEEKNCTHCLSNNHNSSSSWYKHPELATEKFCQRYPTSEKRKAALVEIRNKMSEWDKAHPKKGMKVNICANVTVTRKKKDYQWYMNTAAAVNMTHDPRFYINADLDQVHELFEMADGHKIQTQAADTIALETLLDDKSAYVHLHNVHYCLELDFNLLSLGILEKKGFQFVGKQGFL